MTDAYRARLVALRDRVDAAVRRSWTQVALADLDGSFQAWQAAAAATVEFAQAHAIAMTDGYLAAFLTSELGRRVQPRGIDSAARSGTDQWGRPLSESLRTPIIAVRMGLLHRQPASVALQAGGERAARIAAAAAMSAPRAALTELMSESGEVAGWQRVAAGSACGACLALAGEEVHAPDAALEIHDGCACTQEPVADGVQDLHARPTGQEIFDSKPENEQDALFEGRGGAEKAALIRGGLPLSALVSRQQMALGGTAITEAPLQDLQHSA